MWHYALAAIAALGIGVAVFCWGLYRNAIRREVATSEVLASVLLSPLLHAELQDVAYNRITERFPTGAPPPSEVEVAALQQELMTIVGDSAFRFAVSHGMGLRFEVF
jgi:hypothetical protein